jgi:hypothetical protein
MKRKLLTVMVLGLVLLSGATALADGDIYVGGPWGTKITSLPYEIKTPGSYYLGGNLSYAGPSDGITISRNDVTLDLMGFSLNYTGTDYPSGIYMAGRTNVEIRNGTVSGWGCGIFESDYGLAHRVINVRAVGNTRGIWLIGTGHLVTGCEATSSGQNNAIYISSGGMVTGCTMRFINGGGLEVGRGITSGNVVIGTYIASTGIYSAGTGSVVRGNEVSGGTTGISCGSGTTIIGNTVNTSSGSTGLSLSDVASNVLDQNTVTGAGTPYSPSAFSNAKRRSNYPEASSP